MHNDEGTKLNAALKDYFANAKFARSIRGAESAWRGFELQTLYICSRLLDACSSDYVFWPETVEDLLIADAAATTPMVELVQIKTKSSPLQLSDVASPRKGSSEGKEDELFGHVAFLLGKGVNVRVTVVVYGELGTELRGFSEGKSEERGSVLKKIRALYGDDVANHCVDNLRFEEKDPDELRKRIDLSIEEILEVSAIPQWFANTLIAEVRNRSLSRTSMVLADVNDIARGMAIGAAAQSSLISQYGKTLFPLSERFKLCTFDRAFTDEYRLGVDAQPKHIAASCDVVRPQWIDAIDFAFMEHDLVIVQGASGQGKSTLCLRYLYNRVPVYDSYMVEGSLDSGEANEIAAVLVELARQSGKKIHIYIDGASDRHWVKMAQSLHRKARGMVRILVSIRDDDMNRIPFSEKDLPHTVVRPSLCREEAERIYARYEHPAAPSFEESWRSFGGQGPLMEYTASLGTGSTLQEMLRAQIEGLIAEGHDDDWLYALLLANVLGAEGVTVSYDILGETSGCSSMTSFVERVRNEHMLRIGEDGTIGPLHPYRSRLISLILKEKLPFDRGRLAVDVVKCATRNLGTVLVRLADDASLASPFDIGKLVRQAGKSWVKLSEVLKFALWLDTRKLFLHTAPLRERLMKVDIMPSLAFMLSGGVADEHGSFETETLLDLVDERIRSEVRQLISEAGDFKVDYTVSMAALETVQVDWMEQPDCVDEVGAAGFVLVQFVAREMVSECLTNKISEFCDGFDSNSFPLEETLDYALGLQLCGGSLCAECARRLEERIVEEHTVVWQQYDGSKVDMLQVPYGDIGDLNSYLVDALVDYRRLYPYAGEYWGRQLGIDVWVPEEYAAAYAKHIPAENLPFYSGTMANKLFLAMCDYEEAMASWDDVASAISEGASVFQEMASAFVKAVDRLFEKGSASKYISELDEFRKALADVLDRAKVSTPKDALDPQSFTAYVSPVDVRNYREADGSSVYKNGPSHDRFRKTRSLMNSMQTFGANYPAALLLLMGKDESAKRKQQIRSQIVLLADAAKDVGLAEAEQETVFGRSLMPNDMEEDLVILCCALNVCLSKALRKERGVGYSQTIRARKLMRCREEFAVRLSSIDGIDAAQTVDGSLAFAVDLGALEKDSSFEELAAATLKDIYGDLGGVDCIAESMLLGSYLGDIVVDLMMEGYYFGGTELRASSLVQYAGDGKSPIYGPVPSLPERVSAYKRNDYLDLYFSILDIQKIARICLNINQGIIEKDSEFKHITEAYETWQQLILEQLDETLKKLRPLLLKALGSLGDDMAEVVEEFELVVRGMPKDVEGSVVDYLGQLSELVLQLSDIA